MCQRVCCDWWTVVRGARPLVGCHGFSRVGSFGGRGCLSVSLVKAVLRALISRLLSQELKTHIAVQAVSQNETSLGDRSSFRTLCLRWVEETICCLGSLLFFFLNDQTFQLTLASKLALTCLCASSLLIHDQRLHRFAVFQASFCPFLHDRQSFWFGFNTSLGATLVSVNLRCLSRSFL